MASEGGILTSSVRTNGTTITRYDREVFPFDRVGSSGDLDPGMHHVPTGKHFLSHHADSVPRQERSIPGIAASAPICGQVPCLSDNPMGRAYLKGLCQVRLPARTLRPIPTQSAPSGTGRSRPGLEGRMVPVRTHLPWLPPRRRAGPPAILATQDCCQGTGTS